MMPRTVMAGSIGVELIEEDDTICSWLAAGNAFETDSLARWADICARGGTVLDIGSYTGLFSIVAAKQGCDVIAFEPMPRHFKRCTENFALNDVTVDVRNVCVSDKGGDAVIKYNPNVRGLTSGASLLYPSGGRKGEEAPHPVKSVTIDGLRLEQCTAIKIDVERAEPMVLAGTTETLARCRPVLLVEVLGDSEKSAVRAAAPGYRVVAELDERNWIMEAR